MSRFHKFLGSATRLSHLKNFPFGVVVASAPQIKHFNVLLVFLCDVALGRWSSDAYNVYIKLPFQCLASA